ncbi:MAG: methyltransferase domain-containing protein [Chloroflexi bacterium]|nr:methyltransferase domain-containing protein [Chloroflexota bacterium]
MPSVDTRISVLDDRARWNKKYRGAQAPRRVNKRLTRLAHLLKPGRVLDLAGGMGQNARWLAEQSAQWRVVVSDISDEGLSHAAPYLPCVLANACALPFPPNIFDTILCTRFFDPRVNFAALLAPGGTVFFETFTVADQRYYPAFNPAHRFDPATIPAYFANLELLHLQETDNGHRAYVTVIARRGARIADGENTFQLR